VSAADDNSSATRAEPAGSGDPRPTSIGGAGGPPALPGWNVAWARSWSPRGNDGGRNVVTDADKVWTRRGIGCGRAVVRP